MNTYIITAINDVTNEIKKVSVACSTGFNDAAKCGIYSLSSMGYNGFTPIEVKIAPDNTLIGII